MNSVKNVQRQKIPLKCELTVEKNAKSFKTTRKKEHRRNHDLDDPGLHSNLNNLISENQVPSTKNHHHFLRKNDNKTEIHGVQDTISVKETKTSRLRSTYRLPLSNPSSPLSKSSKATNKSIEKQTNSKPLTNNSVDSKAIDKSTCRKSYLNRSHTSETVHDNISFFRESNIKRQSIKLSNLNLIEKNDEKHESLSASPLCEVNNIGKIKDLNCVSQVSKDGFNSTEDFVYPVGKCFFKTSPKEKIKFKQLDNDYALKNCKKARPESLSPKFPLEYSQKKLQINNNNKAPTCRKSKNLDVVASAKNLTASTLKIITRLDEINNKSRTTKNIFLGINDKEISKNFVKLNSVVNAKGKNEDGAKNRNNVCLKNSTLSNSIKILRLKTYNNFQKDLVVPEQSKDSHKFKNEKSIENKSKPSILKHKYDCENSQILDTKKSKPISILKKKSFNQDELSSASLPVTYSFSVLNREINTKIHGILKKRLSLDENEVLRRRSHSPEANISDFKSILKNQRRSSMIELTKRSQSPDFTIQGILKQKLGNYENCKDFIETQGILKKKFISSLNSSSNIDKSAYNLKVFKKVNSTSDVKITENQAMEFVRPILKKKTFFDEYNFSDLNLNETPKSILKKKVNLEPDQSEEMPKKPILKSYRQSSVEKLGLKQSDINFSGTESDSVKPILKRDNKYDSKCDRDEENCSVLHRRNKQRTKERPFSSPDIEEKLSAFFMKRRSLQFNLSTESLDLGANGTSSNGNDSLVKPPSVLKNINNFENYLKLRCLKNEEENILTSSSGFNSQIFTNLRQSESPVEIPISKPLESKTYKVRENICQQSSSTPNRISCKLSPLSTDGNIDKKEKVACFTNEKFKTDVEVETLKVNIISHFKSEEKCCRTSENIFPANLKGNNLEKEILKSEQENVPNSRHSAIDSKRTLMEFFGPPNFFKEKDEKTLKVSDKTLSVDEMAQSENAIFAGNECKSCLEERVSKDNGEEKNPSNIKFHRFHTQPVSTEELKLAFDKNKSVSGLSGEEKNYEDELSKMSYSDRLKMFEAKFVSHNAALLPKKRETRFKTQPVTAIEVESAKNKNLFITWNKKEDSNKPILERKSSNEDVLKTMCLNLDFTHQISKEPCKDLSFTKKELISELKNMLNQPSTKSWDNSEKTNESSSEKSPEENLRSNNSKISYERNLSGTVKKLKQKKDFLYDNAIEKQERFEHLPNDGKLRIISKSRGSSSMVKSQSHFSVPEVFQIALKIKSETSLDEDDKNDGSNKILRKSASQHFNVTENYMEEDISGGTIRERLERLKKSGETDWQKRKSQIVDIEKEISILGTGNPLLQENNSPRTETSYLSNVNYPLQNEDEQFKVSSILADRMGKLDAAKEDWKKRIKPLDTINFSVDKKILEQSKCFSTSTLTESPSKTLFVERKKRCPKAAKFKSRRFMFFLNSVPTSPLENIDNPIVRSLSSPGNGQRGLLNLSKTDDFKKISVRVPKIDDETFTSFFKDISKKSQEHLEIKDEDLDVITEKKSSQLLTHKKGIKTQKRRATIKNPLRALAARLEPQEYVEIKTEVAENELKKVKSGKGSKTSNLAIETLAGLASQEDFTAVNLRKASEGSFNSQDPPYKNLMLLQVKGRRHVQTRLIEPLACNVNAGDCFILVTPQNVYNYIGEFANVIEMSRSAEISLYIQQTGDLGCTTDSVITIGKNGKATVDQVLKFWELLNGNPNCEKSAGNSDEDELFESFINDTNKIYEVVGNELVPNELFWGCSPKIEILDPNKILIFDFGSELYVWNGKNVNLEKRKFAMKLAKEFWEEGYDYRECDLCPLVAASYVGEQNCCFQIPESSKVGSIRPQWSLFAKIAQNMETVLFKEKFQDWPEYSRNIRKNKKCGENNQKKENSVNEPKPCDAKIMIESEVPEQDLVLEGSHLGRGLSYFDEETRRCSKITTCNIRVWRVSDYEYFEVTNESIGQFYMEDSYIVRWHYFITSTGRELNGQPSKHLTTGRDRYAYFFWQGCDSHINDKGTAACLTVELDKEKGPQIRVDQGLEPPAFLNLFQGRMIVHIGKCMSSICKKWRLYICRGETVTECALIEIPCGMRHLRSGASFVLINNEKSLLIVWHGSKTLEHTKKVAVSAAELIQSNKPKDFNFLSNEVTIREEIEGHESDEFLQACGGNNRQLYFSLLEDKDFVLQTPRLFHFTSLCGNFVSSEIASPYLNKTLTTPFPFLQNDLYSASQPALFLMDTSLGLWLWQGWCKMESKYNGSSENIRFQAERRAALNTVKSYWKLRYGTQPMKAYLIWAGLEPLAFTNQFPFWTDRDDIAEINLKEGKKFGEMISVEEELASLTQSTYSLSQLQNRPLPEGVNPTSLEDYLQPQCFQELFGLEKEEFFKMPSWKKKKLKQEAGLF